MTMIELNTIDPMIGKQQEVEYLIARVHALERIIVEQTAFNYETELFKFMRIASQKYDKLLAMGWDAEGRRFRNSNLDKRWRGWLDRAKAAEIKGS